jgi:hypothetical protein
MHLCFVVLVMAIIVGGFPLRIPRPERVKAVSLHRYRSTDDYHVSPIGGRAWAIPHDGTVRGHGLHQSTVHS